MTSDIYPLIGEGGRVIGYWSCTLKSQSPEERAAFDERMKGAPTFKTGDVISLMVDTRKAAQSYYVNGRPVLMKRTYDQALLAIVEGSTQLGLSTEQVAEIHQIMYPDLPLEIVADGDEDDD